MHLHWARRAGISNVGRQGRYLQLGLGLLLLCLAGLWSTMAVAAPSPHCGPFNISVAHGGSHTIDASACDGPDNLGIGTVETHPTNGTATTNQLAQTVTYVHNGNTATSDTFVFDDGLNNDVTVNVTIGAPTSPIIVSPASISPVLGVPFSQALSATGGVGPYSFVHTSGTLPTGLTFSGGAFGGTPTQRGNFAVNITVTDSTTPTPLTTVKSYAIVIPIVTPVISPTTLPAMAVGIPYNTTLSSSGGVAPYIYSVQAAPDLLPPGLSLSSGGVISGTPTTTGTYTFRILSEDSSGSQDGSDNIGNRLYTVTVTAAPTIVVNPASIPSGAFGTPYSATFSGSGGTAPYTFAIVSPGAGNLPAGLSLNPTTGALTGTPTVAGTFTFTVRATDANSFSGTRDYTLNIAAPTIVVAPPTLPAGLAGTAYSQTVSASGGTGPYTFAIVSPGTGSLPAGLTLNPTTGVLSGTPTVAGTFTFTVRATDANSFSGTRDYSLSIAAPTIVVAPPTLTAGEAGTPYSATVTASGGAGPYTFAIVSPGTGSLPAGLSLNPSTGVLSGTPTATGSFTFTVRATDANSFTGTRDYTLSIVAPTIVVAPLTLASGQAGVAYTATLSASGGNGPYSFAVTSATPLPPGLTLAAGGAISGTPTSTGSFPFTITATDSTPGGPYTGNRAYTVTIAAPTLVLPPTSFAPATVSSAYSATINPASGGTAPYTYTLDSGTLPAGMSLSTAGVISGTPTGPGTSAFTIRATDSTGGGTYSITQNYSLTVVDIVPVANPVSATVAYNSGANPITLNITGGTPTSVAIAAAPAQGTAIASGTSITYQPATGYRGVVTFSYTATNTAGTSAPAIVTVTVGNPTINISVSDPLSTQIGVAYTQTFTWSGGASPYSGYTITNLPAGLSITATTADSATVSGTPTAGGSFSLGASATDSSTGTGPFTNTPQAFTLTVGAPTLAMTPAPGNLPMNYGVATTVNFAASGGSAPYSFSIASGSLPVGVSFSSAGVLSGTPTVPGNYNVGIRVQDSSTGTGAPFALQQSYTIVVAVPSIVLDPPTLPNGTAGTAYNATITATGGVAPYNFSLLSGALPVGMTFSSAGALSGVPRSDGNFSLTVQGTDSNGQTGSRVYTFTIAPATVVISPATLPGGVVGVPYNQSLSSSGGIAPYSYSIVSGNLPVGLSFSSAGVYSGTPTTAGSYTANIRSTDDAGYNTTVPLTIVIVDAVPVAVDDSATTMSNQAVTIPVTANDTGIIASVAVASAPSHGTAVVSGLDVVYTPTSNYFGSDSFTYTASGPGGTSAPATVTITVNALPVPQGQSQTATILSTQTATIDAAAGATGSPFTGVTLLSPPSSGTAVVSGTQIVYTPAANTVGPIALVYTLNNAFGPSAPITSTITVNAVPVAQSRRVRTIAGAAITVDLTAGATGGPFTAANLVSLTPASSGSAAISGSGGVYTLRYTSVIGFSGVAVASFTLNNAHATSAVATIEIEVAPRSDPSKDAEVLGVLNAQASATRRFANSQIGNFQQRMQGMHEGGSDGARFDNGLSFSIDQRCRDEARRTPGSDCRQPLLGDEQAAIEPKPPVEGSGTRYGIWTGGSINTGNRDGRGGGSAGLDFETSGISAGADYRLRDDFALGGGIGYGRDDTDVGQRGSRSKAKSYSAVLYASYHPGESFYLDGLLGYQWLSFDTRRYVTDTGGMVRGDRDGTQWFASVSAGMDYRRDRLHVSPYARLDVARARLDGYTEQGDASYSLTYQDMDVDTTTTSLGVRLDYRYPVRLGTFSPMVLLEYQHDFQDESFATMSYADMVGGPFFRARLEGLDRNRFVFGIGAVLQTERDLVLRFEYHGLFGSGNDDDNSFMINIEKKY